MLKSRSKEAAANLYNYIREYSEDYLQDNYSIPAGEIKTKTALYKAIFNIFLQEMRPDAPYNRRRSEERVFYDWAQGLAMGGLFCYYYNREAAADVSEILEETPEDVAKYKNKYKDESKAEELLTHLIYREISREANRA